VVPTTVNSILADATVTPYPQFSVQEIVLLTVNLLTIVAEESLVVEVGAIVAEESFDAVVECTGDCAVGDGVEFVEGFLTDFLDGVDVEGVLAEDA
jgi:hypothetical protein